MTLKARLVPEETTYSVRCGTTADRQPAIKIGVSPELGGLGVRGAPMIEGYLLSKGYPSLGVLPVLEGSPG